MTAASSTKQEEAHCRRSAIAFPEQAILTVLAVLATAVRHPAFPQARCRHHVAYRDHCHLHLTHSSVTPMQAARAFQRKWECSRLSITYLARTNSARAFNVRESPSRHSWLSVHPSLALLEALDGDDQAFGTGPSKLPKWISTSKSIDDHVAKGRLGYPCTCNIL